MHSPSPFLDPGPPRDAIQRERVAEKEEARERAIERDADEIASDIQGGHVQEHIDDLSNFLFDFDEADIVKALYKVAEEGDKKKAREIWQALVEEASYRIAERRVDDG